MLAILVKKIILADQMRCMQTNSMPGKQRYSVTVTLSQEAYKRLSDVVVEFQARGAPVDKARVIMEMAGFIDFKLVDEKQKKYILGKDAGARAAPIVEVSAHQRGKR